MNNEYIYKFNLIDSRSKTDAFLYIISPVHVDDRIGEIFDENNIILKSFWTENFPYLDTNIDLTYNKYKELEKTNYSWVKKINIIENFRNLNCNKNYKITLLSFNNDVLCQYDGSLKEIIEFYFNFADAKHSIQLVPKILSIEEIVNNYDIVININDIIYI